MLSQFYFNSLKLFGNHLKASEQVCYMTIGKNINLSEINFRCIFSKKYVFKNSRRPRI